MTNVWFIGDTHFGHSNILKFSEARRHFKDIDHHNQTLIENWNSIIKPNDKVYHLGDVSFGRDNLRHVRKLNGNKTLIMGNHDKYSVEEYIHFGFTKVVGCMKYMEFVLSHIPIHPEMFEYRWEYNIHGHIHMKGKYTLDSRYVNVNACVRDLMPVSLEQVRREAKPVDKS